MKERTYTRHPSRQFFVSGSASSGDLKLLVPRSPKGLWSHVLPDPLRHVDLAQCYSSPAGHGVTSRPGVYAVPTDAHEVAAAPSEEPIGWIQVQEYELRCFHSLNDTTPLTVEVSRGLSNGNGSETYGNTVPLPGPFASRAAAHLHSISEESCGLVFDEDWVPRDVMLVWQVREHCFQPDRGWQGSDRFLSLSIDDIVVVRKRYSCGWEGWASGTTWGMRKGADGVFPLTVVVPMVLIDWV